jgi:adenylate cyclase, class 2
MSVENEIKLRVASAEEGRRMLEAAGFLVTVPRVFESNDIVDTADGRMRTTNSILRLRLAGDICTLTWKGPLVPWRHRAREEREVRVSSYNEMKFILDMTGFASVFRYEKYRTEFQQSEWRLAVVLDETPIGVFVELEGEPDAVDKVAAKLGFNTSSYITKSYGALYQDHCASNGVTPTNMVFV